MQQTATRPRSRPSDKQPIKRGYSSSSNTNNPVNQTQDKTEIARADPALDESAGDGSGEEYEPQFDEEEEDDDQGQVLNKSKPQAAPMPFNEEVKEMKSVDEETNKNDDEAQDVGEKDEEEEEDYSEDQHEDNNGTGIDLQDINDL
jgi:hypothetical protein